MIRGFSDARIAVMKRGSFCREQGELCSLLTKHVCPEVYELLYDGYEMEMLQDPEHRLHREWYEVYHRLQEFVWSRNPTQEVGGWLQPLYTWAENDHPWITPVIQSVYGDQEPISGYSMVHGDPTLANIMIRRSTGAVVITDPMGRYPYRREIPERPAVDIGKLIQSACGWERVLLLPGGTLSLEQDLFELTQAIPENLRKESLLWGAIHIARVFKRATDKSLWRIADWASESTTRLCQILHRRHG